MKFKNRINKKTLFWSYLVLMLVVKLFLSTGFRVWAFGDNPYDDGMMVLEATKLIDYKWLGHFTQYTLAKGMIFPLYLCLINKIGLPFLFSMVLLSFGACVTFVLAIRKLIPNRLLLALFFTVLMFNPISNYYWTFNRVYRDSIYSYLVIFSFSFIIALFLNRTGTLRKTFFLSIGTGISLAAVWLAREDSPWIVPYVGLALLITVVSILLNKELHHKFKRLLAIGITPAILIISILGVSTINYIGYGVFATNEFTGGSLPVLMKELQSIKPDVWMAKVPIPESTREKAYAVSPTFAKLKPVLETHGFVTLSNGNPTCDMLVWAVVDSVQYAGMTDGKSSQLFYKKAAAEIQSAIDKGELQTRGGYVSVFESPWDNRYITPLLQSLSEAIHMTVSMKGYHSAHLEVQNVPSSGTDAQIRQIEEVTNNLAYYKSEVLPERKSKADFLSQVRLLYEMCNPAITALGILCYIYIFIRFLLSIRSKKYVHFEAWIILTGLYLSYLLRLSLICYSNVSCNFMLYPMYLAPAYWLILMTTFLSIMIAGKDLWHSLKDKIYTPKIRPDHS
ncbi:hypothetical protein [Ethanoligenens sp.]|uniref:hypothetical protein n=1 Tax=Ethanoligenens sp. TaxID=2099655 RepID=UPI0039EA2745